MTTFEKIALGALVVCILFFYFENLGRLPLYDYDEATYADVAVKMVNGVSPQRDALTLYRFDQEGKLAPWFEKPPLMFWLMAGSMKVFGVGEFGARFPSAVFGALSIVILVFIGKQLSGSWTAGILAGAVLLSSALYLDAARQGRLDSAVIFWMLAAFWAFLKSFEKPAFWLLVGLFLGLGFLAKSAVVFLAVPAVLIYLLIQNRSAILPIVRSKWLWFGVGVFLATVLPWHLYESAKFGRAFWNSYLLHHVFERAGTNILGAERGGYPVTLYVSYLWQFFQPWVFFFLGAVLVLFFVPKESRRLLFVPVIISLFILLFFTVVPTKLGPYVLPFTPFAALAIGAAGAAALASVRSPLLVAAILLIAFGYGMARSYSETHTSLLFTQDEKAIGLLVKNSSKQAFLLNWPVRESLMFYSQKGIRGIAGLGEIPQPLESLLILPTSYAKALVTHPPYVAKTGYSGEVLSLLEFVSSK